MQLRWRRVLFPPRPKKQRGKGWVRDDACHGRDEIDEWKVTSTYLGLWMCGQEMRDETRDSVDHIFRLHRHVARPIQEVGGLVWGEGHVIGSDPEPPLRVRHVHRNFVPVCITGVETIGRPGQRVNFERSVAVGQR